MTQSEFVYSYEVGQYHTRVYQIGVRADPNLNTVESFAAVLFYERANGERIEIAKIDNSEHDKGSIHIDRYYREEGAERKDFDIGISTVYEADDHLADNWRRYVRLYLENHESE
ncbi:DUF7718 family protein [Haladaptatus halobius]|uniref:DUF7718 family protein n=1 Tax=Haladaptatus halobius TaxID=2884875 RepID=UPI001D09D5E7|nr:hypothetical protein [Haladaptatus halobius]